jgi:hypothetical protein
MTHHYPTCDGEPDCDCDEREFQDLIPNAFATTDGIPIEVNAEFDGGVYINAWREEGAIDWHTVESCPEDVVADVLAEIQRENA